jgi:hypothetical protein
MRLPVVDLTTHQRMIAEAKANAFAIGQLAALTAYNALVDALELVGGQTAQVAWIETVWRAPSPATTIVLVALGKVHPVKAVAKAARKASFKRQSATIDRP